MYLLSKAILLLSPLLTGQVKCLPVNGGIDPVTPGRLIPVSEATDDLPTPGYRMIDLRQRLLDQPQQFLEGDLGSTAQSSTALSTSDIGKSSTTAQSSTALPTSVTAQFSTSISTSQTTQLTTLSPEAGKSVSTTESVESNSTSTTETTQTSSVVSTSETSHSTTESASPTLNKDASKIPVEEGLMKKVILPELCSITGLGCRATPKKPADSESQEKLENVSSESSEKDDIGKESEKEFPGNFFLENSQRISPIGNSISSTTENVMFETAHIDSKDGYQNNEHLKEQNESDQTTESSSSSGDIVQTTNDASSSEHSMGEEVNISSTEQDRTVQEKKNEQALQTIVQEETFVRGTNLDNSHSITGGEANQHVLLEDHPQLILQEENQDELRISKSNEETPQVANKSIRRLDDIKIAEEQPGMKENEETTTRKDIKGISEQPKKNTKTSEEEQKLMEVSPFDEMKAVGEESLSIGDRISNYWHAATDYVSKVLNI